MMSTRRTQAGGRSASDKGVPPTRDQIELSEEDRSKDGFFVQMADIAEAMIARHGKEFAMGTLVLTAKFIAEGKSLTQRAAAVSETQRTSSGPS